MPCLWGRGIYKQPKGQVGFHLPLCYTPGEMMKPRRY